MIPVQTPLSVYSDVDGSPLDNGRLYFGVANQNPETSPIVVCWDDAGTQPAAQPIRTLNGIPVRNGKPSRIFVPAEFSLTVRNKKGELVYYAARSGDALLSTDSLTGGDLSDTPEWDPIPATYSPVINSPVQALLNRTAFLESRDGSTKVGFLQSGTGAVPRTLQDKSRERVSVKDFGAVGDNVTDDTAAIQLAINAVNRGEIIFPPGIYKITDTISVAKNNIALIGLSSAVLMVPSTVTTSTGFALDIYNPSGTQPVNARLHNVNVEISTNGGGNTGGIRWGASYSSMKNVNVRIRGDNMIGVRLATQDGGTGPYYGDLEQVYVQGDSNSVTPLLGTKGFEFFSSIATPSRSPNANTLVRCRVGGVYDAYDVKGAGNTLISCTSEAINRYHYYCNHPSISSGAIRNLIINPYCEQYPTSTVFASNSNASACVIQNPYYTGIGTVFVDNSTLKNCRLIDVETLPLAGSPVARAAAKVTGTTVNRGFNVANVTTTGTGIFRVNFTEDLGSVDYFVSCVAASNDAIPRVSVYNSAYVQFFFFDASGNAINPTGFSVTVSR